MPSLFRLLFTLAVLGGIAYGIMYALVVYVQPNEREVSVRVPKDRLKLERIEIAPQPIQAPEPESDEPAAE